MRAKKMYKKIAKRKMRRTNIVSTKKSNYYKKLYEMEWNLI